MAGLPPQPYGVPPDHSYWNDWYQKLRALINSGVVFSVNGRTGAVTIISADVTGALGFTPANINSPTFTGDPKAPTPAPGDNDTSIATTAFVTAAITIGLNITITTAKLTAGGTNGSMTFTNGVLTAQVAAT